MRGSLLTRVGRISAELLPRGQIIVIEHFPCQLAEDRVVIAERLLGRRLERGDIVVVIKQTDACPQGGHVHEDHIILHPRVD